MNNPILIDGLDYAQISNLLLMLIMSHIELKSPLDRVFNKFDSAQAILDKYYELRKSAEAT